MKQRSYYIGMKTADYGETHYCNRHYRVRMIYQTTPATTPFMSLYELTHRVKKPSKTMLMNVYADLTEMKDKALHNHPATELAALSEVASQMLPMRECLKWMNADGSLKSFRVSIKDKMVWRTVSESADSIAGFDSSAHEFCINHFGDVDGLDEHAEYLAAIQDACNVHASLRRATSELSQSVAIHESNLRRIDNIQAQIVSLLS